MALHLVVDELDDFLGKEAVDFAQREEQPGVALLGRVAALALLLFAFRLLSFALTLGNLLDFGRVGVVAQEAAELAAEQSLHDVVLVEPGPTLLHVVHEGRDLLLVDLHALYFVDDVVELLAADFAGLGQRLAHEFLLYDLFHLADFEALPHVHDAYRGALLAGTARAAAAVGVVLHVVGHTVVDDVRQVVDVEPAGRHVGGHEQLYPVLAEALHGEVALLLAEVAVQGVGVVSVAYEPVGHLLRLHACAAEDDGIDAGIVVHHALQGQVLVLGRHHVVDVVHVLGALVAAAYLYRVGVAQVLLGDALDFAAHGGREEQRAVLLGHALEYGVKVFLETHREHLVGLVEHQVAHVVEHGHLATVHQVDQSAGRGNDDVHPAAQGANLGLDVGAAVDGQDAHLGHVLGKALQVVGYLQAQLARGTEDEHLRTARGLEPLHQLEQRQSVGRRLASSRLGQRHQVLLLLAQQPRDYLLLHGHGVFVTLFVDGPQQLLSQAHFLEFCHLSFGFWAQRYDIFAT